MKQFIYFFSAVILLCAPTIYANDESLDIFNAKDCVFTYEDLFTTRDLGIKIGEFRPKPESGRIMSFSVTEIILKAKGSKYYRYTTFRNSDDGGNTIGWVETPISTGRSIVAEIGDSEYFNCEILVGGATEHEVALEKLWIEFEGTFNAEADFANDHGFSVFEFGSQDLSEVSSRESEEIRYNCNTESASDYMSFRTLNAGEFMKDHSQEIAKNIQFAIEIEDETRDGFLSLIDSVASLSESIKYLGTSGDCQGHWGNSHYFLETQHRRYSISIGGGE